MANLKREVDRLSAELHQACQEKIQAAEYGLAVLEEKQQLQELYDSLLANNEQKKQENSHLKQVLIKVFSHIRYKFLIKLQNGATP